MGMTITFVAVKTVRGASRNGGASGRSQKAKGSLRFPAVVERGRRVPIRERERTITVTVVSRVRHNFAVGSPV
jgi:hypothetical protein